MAADRRSETEGELSRRFRLDIVSVGQPDPSVPIVPMNNPIARCPRCGEILEIVFDKKAHARSPTAQLPAPARVHQDKDDCLIALLRVVVHELRESKNRHAVERGIDTRLQRY